nr:MAG TPA: hypothetical protein [Caudoviricetes sp.]
MKRDTPPGWTSVLTEGVTIRSPPCKGALFWGTLRRKIGQRGG